MKSGKMLEMEIAKLKHKQLCLTFQQWDRNGCFMDDLEERQMTGNLAYEVELFEEIIEDWYDNKYLDELEYVELKTINSECSHYLERSV
jgi:hypothetical protein